MKNAQANNTNTINDQEFDGAVYEELKALAPQPATRTELLALHGNKSNAIRALHAAGMSRGDIAKVLEIKYQHVRNVLITPLKKFGQL